MFSSLQHRLARRLILGTLVVAALCGAITFVFELRRVDDTVISLATAEAEAFSQHFPNVVRTTDGSAMETRLWEFMKNRQPGRQGYFLMAEIYDAEHREVASVGGTLPPHLTEKIETGRHRFPDDHRPWLRKILADDEVYIQVVTRLTAPDGSLRGYFEGVYDIPPLRMAEIKGRVTISVLQVMLVATLTTLVLFPLIRGLYREQQALSVNLLKANFGTLAVLGSAIAKRDSDTQAHNFRVALYALGLAEALGLKPRQIHELLKGAWLHDVGKIGISDTILLKPGKLDDAEFTVMKTHVQHGLDIVGQYDWLKDAAQVVGGHHEKWDGSGYPVGLSGPDIPLNARIFALADVFDALTSRRPYKEAFPLEKALGIMAEGRARHFDPELFDQFVRIVPGMYAEFGGREDDTAEKLLIQKGYRYFIVRD